MLPQRQRKTFTTDEYHRMIETGILKEDDRLELVRGEIIYMAPIGSHHAACVKRLNRLFARTLSEMVILGVQDPVSIGEDSEPEPDITLLKPRPDFYAERHPRSEDVFLIVEVADTSLESDRREKLPLYARAGIGEVWIVNLRDGCVEVYSEPSGGKYQGIRILRKGSAIAPEAFPDTEISVEKMLILS
ncbi:Uma2 family endonuclease [Desulfococcaceae bacterium HSG8]|nr:Uma2 family endonuclease [Desulfococcaceae bacterium HSG8]